MRQREGGDLPEQRLYPPTGQEKRQDEQDMVHPHWQDVLESDPNIEDRRLDPGSVEFNLAA